MARFEQQYMEWLEKNLTNEINPRRRELLAKGLGHGTVEFLKRVWFPAVGNFDHLFPEWEVRDFNNGYRYLDLLNSLLFRSNWRRIKAIRSVNLLKRATQHK